MLHIEVNNKLRKPESVQPIQQRLEEGWYFLVCRDATPNVREKDGAKYYKFKFEVLKGKFKGRYIYASFYPYLSRHKIYINNLLKSFGFNDVERTKFLSDETCLNACTGLYIKGQLFQNGKYNNLEFFAPTSGEYDNGTNLLTKYNEKQHLVKEVVGDIGDVMY